VTSSQRSAAARGDLTDEDEIAALVRAFYRRVAQDDLLGPVFEDVAQVDWPSHLDKLTAFWSRILRSRPGYQGNPYTSHQRIHAVVPFTRAHFDRWLDLFEETIDDEGWAGPTTTRAIEFAHHVAVVHHRGLTTRAPRPTQPVAEPTAGPAAGPPARPLTTST
jgi:hemoglobin